MLEGRWEQKGLAHSGSAGDRRDSAPVTKVPLFPREPDSWLIPLAADQKTNNRDN